MTNPHLPKDFPAIVHCESALLGDPLTSCGIASGRDTAPQWGMRAFVFAVRHPDLADRCCPACVAQLLHLLGGIPKPEV